MSARILGACVTAALVVASAAAVIIWWQTDQARQCTEAARAVDMDIATQLPVYRSTQHHEHVMRCLEEGRLAEPPQT